LKETLLLLTLLFNEGAAALSQMANSFHLGLVREGLFSWKGRLLED